MQTKKVFWHMLLHSYLCNALFFAFHQNQKEQMFSQNIFWNLKQLINNPSKEETVLSCDSKELFVQ